MISFLVFLFWFAVGSIFAMMFGAQIYLPLLYNLPISIYLALKKRIKVRAIPYVLIAPTLWTIALILFGFFFPRVALFLQRNNGFVTGEFVGSLFLVGQSLFTRKGRSELWHDFYNLTYRRYTTHPLPESTE